MINSGKASVSDLKKLHKPYISQRGKPAEMCKKTGMINENEGADWLERTKNDSNETKTRLDRGDIQLQMRTHLYACRHLCRRCSSQMSKRKRSVKMDFRNF